MKTTTVTRILGVEGKFVIPVEIRRRFDINHNDYIEIYLEADKKIVMVKYYPRCILCDCDHDLIVFKDTLVCQGCVGKVKELNRT